MADWYLYIGTPTTIDVYPIGDYQALGEAYAAAQVAAGMAAHGVPEDWMDRTGEGWRVDLSDIVYKRGPLAHATRHTGPPDPDWQPLDSP